VAAQAPFRFQNNIGGNRGKASGFGKWFGISKRKFIFFVTVELACPTGAVVPDLRLSAPVPNLRACFAMIRTLPS
jgi:hypothetical protein